MLNSSGGFGVSAVSLIKNGTGSVTFGTANFTTGTTTINNGTMTQAGGTAISGTTAVNNGILSQTAGTAAVGTLQIGANSAAPGTTASLSLTGGTFSATTFDVLSGRDGMTSNLTIGGTAEVTLPTFPTNAKGVGATATLTFDSTTGSLFPAAASTSYLPAGTFTNAYLTANGAKFNVPTGKSITIEQVLENAVSPAAAGTLTKDGTGTLTLSGANSFTGATTIIAGTLSLDNASALGGTSGITLGGASAATLSSAVSGITLVAPITTADMGVTSTIALGRNANSTGSFTLNGPIGGAGNVVFTNPSGAVSNNNLQNINLGAASNYSGTTTFNPSDSGTTMTVRNTSGAANALPATTVLIFGTRAGEGSSRASTYDLGGQNQTLAGMSNAGLVPDDRNQRVSSTATATLTINNVTDFTFGGSTFESAGGTTTRAQITGAISLVKNGVGTFTLGGTLTGGASAGGHTYTGTTTVLGGILVLGETNSVQNSALDTAGSIAGDATNGLQTTVTALTIGGLTGNKNLAAVFSTAGGYGAVTALTLNPGTSASHSYSGVIANGAAGMTLTKSGAGTQTLSGTNTYTGATTVSAGTLALVGGSQTSPITVNNLASLGFTPGSPTTSNSAVTFDSGSTVTITGTPVPATTYTLLTTTATITGTPTLSPLVPGFGLQVDGTNTLKLVPVAGGYAAWQSANSTTQAANLDHDNDGVSNGVEFFIGGTNNTTGFTALPTVNTVGGLSVTWTKHTSYTGSYTTDFVVETSSTLAGPWATEPDPGPTISFPMADQVKFTFPTPLGSKNFARLKVTGP